MRQPGSIHSPLPWSRNPAYDAYIGHFQMPSPILDAYGAPVIDPSEWLTIRSEDLDLIIQAVNATATSS